jgi:hypothetical protein
MDNLEIGSWPELLERLRRCGTEGDADLKPYRVATISLERVRIADLVPLAKYVLEEQLQIVAGLHRLLNTTGVNIFDLEAGIVWPNGRGQRPVACPIVEYWDREGFLLVDGLHRAWFARNLGHTELACAVIRDVVVPLVPLPLEWEEVRVYPVGEHPDAQDKRAYRFSDAASLRFAFPPIFDQVTDENFRYFLYRQLDELGSSGIRPPSGQMTDPKKSADQESEEKNESRY